MDDKREERRKESIDEILSDLNGLLNKMPAILDGIKLPDIKPVDFLSPQVPAPVVPDSTPDIKPETASEPASEPVSERVFTQVPEKLPEPEAGAGMAFKRQFPEGGNTPVFDIESLKKEEAAIDNAFTIEPENEEDEKASVLFETTRDFGVPDIDTLIKLSQEVQIVPIPLIKPGDDIQPEPEPVPGPALENIINAPRAGSEDGEGEIMDIKEENPGKEEFSKPAAAMEPALPGPAGPVTPVSPVSEAAAVEFRIERSSPQDFTLKASEPAPEKQGLVIEQSGSGFNPHPPAVITGGEDNATGIPLSIARQEEQKPVLSEAGANPDAASRGQSDLDSLAGLPVPGGIPPERVRTVAFLYAQEDAALCAEILAELDAICLKSPSKPMFIKRGFVLVCAPGALGTVFMQKVTDAGAAGLICVGNIPPETVCEMENVFNAGGMFFRHFSREAFNHSAALDLVTEFILK